MGYDRSNIRNIQTLKSSEENEKRAPNAFAGLLVDTAQYSWSLRTTSEECDAEMEPGWFCKSKVEGLPLWDYLYRTRLNTGGQTCRPIHDFIMDLERTRLAFCYRLVLQSGVPRKDILF